MTRSSCTRNDCSPISIRSAPGTSNHVSASRSDIVASSREPLKRILKALLCGSRIRLIPDIEIYDRVAEVGVVDNLTSLMGTFLRHFKNGGNPDHVDLVLTVIRVPIAASRTDFPAPCQGYTPPTMR